MKVLRLISIALLLAFATCASATTPQNYTPGTTAAPAQAQNSVPPTAMQADKTPQLAPRLTSPAKGKSTSPALPRLSPLSSGDVYDNGPSNGNTDAWTINFGFIVSDSFYLVNNSTTVSGMSFLVWLYDYTDPYFIDTLTSVEVSITSEENGGTTYMDISVGNWTETSCAFNTVGYYVCIVTATFDPTYAPTLHSGTYWVNLQNAVTTCPPAGCSQFGFNPGCS